MAMRHRQIIYIGFLAMLGLALAVSFATHFLLNVLRTWQDWVIALFCLSGLGVSLSYLILMRLSWQTTILYIVRTRLMLVILSLVISGLFIAVRWVQPRHIPWAGGVGTQPQPPLDYFERKAWNEHHKGFEIHATVNDDPQWIWRAYGDLPQTVILFGGTLRLWVTQPEWAVFDKQEHIYQGGDGVEVRFVIDRKGYQETVQRVNLNLHTRSEQRHWQMVDIAVPAGSHRLIVEALPGPPGSNNWHDRIWVGLERIETPLGTVITLADWLSIGLLIFLSGAVMLLVLRPPYVGWKKGTLILIMNVVAIVIFFSVGEIYLRMKGFKPSVRTFPGQYQNRPEGVSWAQVDSLFGWTCNNKIAPEINPQGFRDTKDFNTVDLNSEKIRVMILGDSFILGVNVRATENVPSVLQTKLKDKYEVFNLGMGGWGIDQMYLAYQKYKDVIQPHIVILAFIDDDISRVLEAYRMFEMNKPCLAIKNGELVLQTSVSRSRLFLDRILGKSVFLSLFMRQIYLIKEARPIVKHVFLNIAQETQLKKVKFVVIRIPTKDYANSITNSIQSLYSFEDVLSDTDVQYLEPIKEMTQIPNWAKEFYFKDDGHMSVAGNEYLADYIFRNVFEKSNFKRN